MAKAVSGSLLDQIRKAEVYEEFCALMFDQEVKYEKLLEQLESWSISSSLGALSRFWDSERSPWTIYRARLHAKQAYDMLPEEIDEAQRRALKERVFTLSVSPNVSEKALLKLRDQEIQLLVLQQNEKRLEQTERSLDQAQTKLEQAERRVLALEEQNRQAKDAAARAKESITGSAMDDATRELLLAEVDSIMLGKPRPQQQQPAKAA